MSFIKRVSQILTPPFRHKAKSAPGASPIPDKDATASLVNDILRELCLDQPLEEEKTRRNLEELKKIATAYGGYFTASEIRDCLGRMPESSEKRIPYKKGRGYELAAGLYLQHLRKCIDDIEEWSISPNLKEFHECLSELFSCLLLADKYRKGIEVCLECCESLACRSCYRSNHFWIYLDLSKRTAASLSQAAFEKMEELERDFNLEKRFSRKFDTPPPDEPRASAIIGKALIEHLAELRRQISQVGTDIAKLNSKPVLSREEFENANDENEIIRHLDYLHAVTDVAQESKFLVLAAFAEEQAGLLHEELKRGTGSKFFLGAARLYKAQGDTEQRLHLRNLSNRHYKKASELSIKAVPRN